MPRFQFALQNGSEYRRAGEVTSESFGDALALISEKASAKAGDLLEIGVQGFPPARFECVGWLPGEQEWRPLGRAA